MYVVALLCSTFQSEYLQLAAASSSSSAKTTPLTQMCGGRRRSFHINVNVSSFFFLLLCLFSALFVARSVNIDELVESFVVALAYLYCSLFIYALIVGWVVTAVSFCSYVCKSFLWFCLAAITHSYDPALNH